MAKWPGVPAVYGWLGLNRRGRWLLRGEPIDNRAVNAFIGRNYRSTADGCWFFQNGPQRVFVGLAYTPWVFTLDGSGAIRTHTGVAVEQLAGAWVDDAGNLLLACEHGPGVVDDRDLAALLARFTDAAGRALSDDAVADAIGRLRRGREARMFFVQGERRLPVRGIQAARVPAALGFDPTPRPPDASVAGSENQPPDGPA